MLTACWTRSGSSGSTSSTTTPASPARVQRHPRRAAAPAAQPQGATARRIAAYGAAAKGTILLNYVGIGPDLLDFVVDRNAHKQGRYMPGVRLPIATRRALVETQPDYVLILPWNFKDEIIDAAGASTAPRRPLHRARSPSPSSC